MALWFPWGLLRLADSQWSGEANNAVGLESCLQQGSTSQNIMAPDAHRKERWRQPAVNKLGDTREENHYSTSSSLSIPTGDRRSWKYNSPPVSLVEAAQSALLAQWPSTFLRRKAVEPSFERRPGVQRRAEHGCPFLICNCLFPSD